MCARACVESSETCWIAHLLVARQLLLQLTVLAVPHQVVERIATLLRSFLGGNHPRIIVCLLFFSALRGRWEEDLCGGIQPYMIERMIILSFLAQRRVTSRARSHWSPLGLKCKAHPEVLEKEKGGWSYCVCDCLSGWWDAPSSFFFSISPPPVASSYSNTSILRLSSHPVGTEEDALTSCNEMCAHAANLLPGRLGLKHIQILDSCMLKKRNEKHNPQQIFHKLIPPLFKSLYFCISVF